MFAFRGGGNYTKKHFDRHAGTSGSNANNNGSERAMRSLPWQNPGLASARPSVAEDQLEQPPATRRRRRRHRRHDYRLRRHDYRLRDNRRRRHNYRRGRVVRTIVVVVVSIEVVPVAIVVDTVYGKAPCSRDPFPCAASAVARRGNGRTGPEASAGRMPAAVMNSWHGLVVLIVHNGRRLVVVLTVRGWRRLTVLLIVRGRLVLRRRLAMPGARPRRSHKRCGRDCAPDEYNAISHLQTPFIHATSNCPAQIIPYRRTPLQAWHLHRAGQVQ